MMPEKDILQAGKLPPAHLRKLLQLPRLTSDNLIVPPQTGVDAAVLKLGSRLIAVTTDPITFPTSRPGYFAVHANANDIAVMGSVPRFFTVTLLLPVGSESSMPQTIMSDILEVANDLGIILLGGHTEITAAVNLPVVSITMLGEQVSSVPLSSAGGQIGDTILQVRPAAVEGTAILAAEKRELLLPRVALNVLERAQDFLYDPGLSIVKPAVFAATRLPVHAMHDPTEGGIATGLREIAEASGTGLRMVEAKLIIRPETIALCQAAGINPLGLISSGSLLIALPAAYADAALNMFSEAGHESARIGELTALEDDLVMLDVNGRSVPLPHFNVDELATNYDNH